MKRIDKNIFGPWALVTGSSSGIGAEFARQLAASGLNVVLVARRLPLLEEVGHKLAHDYGIEYRAVELDLAQEHAMETLQTATRDLDIGLVVSNAGTAHPGAFLNSDPDMLHEVVRLSVLTNMGIAYLGHGCVPGSSIYGARFGDEGLCADPGRDAQFRAQAA
jgi:uncharacterized protein